MMNFARKVIDAATALREADNGFVSSPHLELLYRAVDNLKVQKQRSVQSADLRGLLPPEYVHVYELTDRVVEQAALVVASYERHNGYTAGLAVNLQRLRVVVREWEAHLAQL